MKFVRYECDHCGGTDVGNDANAVWDVVTQEQVLGGTFDDEWCSDCGEVKSVEVEITDPAELREILDKRQKLAVEPMAQQMLVQLEINLGALREVEKAGGGRVSPTIGQLIKAHEGLLQQVREKQLISATSAADAPPSPTLAPVSGC